jgi:class 3 adenylate cyclase
MNDAGDAPKAASSWFLAALRRVPRGTAPELQRFVVIARVGYPLGALLHAILLASFWYLDAGMLALFNVASIGIFVLGVWSVVTLRWMAPCFCLAMLVEIPLHAFLATRSFGIEAGFIFHVVNSMAAINIAVVLTRRLRVAGTVALVVAFVAIGLDGLGHPPAAPPGPAWTGFFFVLNGIGMALAVAGLIGIATALVARAERALESERARADGLLRAILPEPVVERLKAGETVIADRHDEVSVLFADMANFTAHAAGLPPERLIRHLDRVFSRFDELAERHGAERIKTMGDSYMAVTGLGRPRPGHADAIAALALDMIDAARELETDAEIPLSLRIGINSGPVVAGVIGRARFAYDLWGDTVNVAARMERLGEVGTICLTRATARRLGPGFRIAEVGEVAVKGRGTMHVCRLEGRSA